MSQCPSVSLMSLPGNPASWRTGEFRLKTVLLICANQQNFFFLCEPRPELRPQPGKVSNKHLTKILILSTGLPWLRSAAEIAGRWRYRLPFKNMKPHYDSQFFVSFHFFIDQEPCKLLKTRPNWA